MAVPEIKDLREPHTSTRLAKLQASFEVIEASR